MKPSQFDTFADTILQHYKAYQLSLMGALMNAIDHFTPTHASVQHELARSIEILQSHTLSGMTVTMNGAAKLSTEEAIKNATEELSAEFVAEIADSIEEYKNELWNKIVTVMMADSAKTIRAFRDFTLNVSLLMNAGQSAFQTALMRARLSLPSGINFTIPDRAGKLWASITYVRTVSRDFIQKSYIEGSLLAISAGGHDLAKVVTQDAEHPNTDMVFSITGLTSGYPTYMDIRETVYQPNSNSVVTAHV